MLRRLPAGHGHCPTGGQGRRNAGRSLYPCAPWYNGSDRQEGAPTFRGRGRGANATTASPSPAFPPRLLFLSYTHYLVSPGRRPYHTWRSAPGTTAIAASISPTTFILPSKKRARARQRPALFSTVFPQFFHRFSTAFSAVGQSKGRAAAKSPTAAERPGLAAGQTPKGRRRGDPALCARRARRSCDRTTSAQRPGGQRRRAAGEGFFFGARALCAPKKKMPGAFR